MSNEPELISRKLLRSESGFEIWEETSKLPNYVVLEYRADDDDSPQTQEVSDAIEEIEKSSGQIIKMEVAYTEKGDYIGNPKMAHRLCIDMGIAPERMSDDVKVCSIGFCEKDQKWYGWSHRAIYGFSIGDEAAEGDCVTVSGWTKEYLDEHPEADTSLPIGFKALTLDDTKKMAVAFSESVS